ncbi:MAG TPA: GNAT family N-acetyltransferase [Candidatus Baltobacteraceae bacterium]|nr:GNAT family N-acetyltransferase [Candidatus Baltobacteraceae bacterium]
MILETPSCIVRPPRLGDAPSVAECANDFDVWRNLRDRFPYPYTVQDAEEWIRRNSGLEPATTFFIEVGGHAAGGIALMPNDDIQRCSAELGYWLGRTFWGRGIVTDAVRAVARYGLERLALTRVYALPFARNAASRRVLAKAGFVEEGILRKAAVKNGEVIDLVMCG